jgi:hypothetical protein
MKKGKLIKKEEVVLIRSCDKLMMDAFIECLLTENYEALIISGKPKPEELIDAWNMIISEYAMLIGSDKYERMIQLTREINSNIFKFNRVELYVNILSKAVDDPSMYSVVLIKELKRFGYPGQYDPKIKSRFLEELNAAYNKAKKLLMSAQLKQDELKKLEGAVEKGKADRVQFDKNFIALSSHHKYQIQESKISAQKYCLMVQDLNRKAELANTKSNGR